MDQLKTLVDESKETHKRTRITIADKELSLKQREDHIQDIRARLNSCSSNKEYQAFMEQIAADEQANSVLSDEIIELLDRSTSDETAVKEAQQALERGEGELNSIRARVEGERSELESEVARIESELKDAETSLPPTTSALSKLMAKRPSHRWKRNAVADVISE